MKVIICCMNGVSTLNLIYEVDLLIFFGMVNPDIPFRRMTYPTKRRNRQKPMPPILIHYDGDREE